MSTGMKVDIWSDIMCPFCYIGKRKLEAALADFDQKDNVEIEWHSFQLDPSMQPQPGKSVFAYLAERKGQTLDWSVKMHANVAQMAKESGLAYNFEKAVIANSFDAHRLIWLAKKHGLGDAAEERIFRAYFTEGKDIGDHDTLLQMGIEIGLSAVETGEMLAGISLSEKVQQDIATAGMIGITGVPFFIINNKYAISGAQPKEVFLSSMQQAWQEHESELKNITVVAGATCTPGEPCETINN